MPMPPFSGPGQPHLNPNLGGASVGRASAGCADDRPDRVPMQNFTATLTFNGLQSRAISTHLTAVLSFTGAFTVNLAAQLDAALLEPLVHGRASQADG